MVERNGADRLITSGWFTGKLVLMVTLEISFILHRLTLPDLKRGLRADLPKAFPR